MSRFSVVINDRRYDVEVYERGDNTFLVRIGDHEYIVYLPKEELERILSPRQEVADRLARIAEESALRAPQPVVQPIAEHGLVISSEIPGRLVKLMITEGDVVEQSQSIAVLESMKMMIEVRSPYRGRVKKILARENSFIDVGQPIAVLEPV